MRVTALVPEGWAGAVSPSRYEKLIQLAATQGSMLFYLVRISRFLSISRRGGFEKK
jgi:hypothetical protein